MLSRFFIAGLLAFLLLGAGYGASQAARTVPWDCADWQAFAHADRATSILESLAENRGKTLYCGIDQSDAFAKAETWEAGRDRNERDDTEYQGENGRFRGFIAAQEGWLTEGESGITGQSIATIFEFPTEGRVVRRTKRIRVGSGSASDNPNNTCMTDLEGGRQPGTLICTDWQTAPGPNPQSGGAARAARRLAIGVNVGHTNRMLDWRTNVRYITNNNYGCQDNPCSSPTNPANPNPASAPAEWLRRAENAARSACRARGARVVAGSADFHAGHNRDNDRGTGAWWLGDGLGLFLSDNRVSSNYQYQARQSRTWSGTCIKKIRRTR